MNGEEIKTYRKKIGLSQEDLGAKVGLSKNTIYNYENGGRIPKSKIPILVKFFSSHPKIKEYKNEDQLHQSKDIEPIYNNNGNKYIELGDGTYDVETSLIPFAAYASYLESVDTGHVEEDFQTMTFNVDRIGRGNYKAFIVKGDSRNGGRINDTPDGAKVLGRELGKHHWRDGIKPSDYGWIILCKENIFHKDIIHTDLTTGEIICHSRNPSPEYSDFTLSLNDCFQIFKVIKRIF